jgi:hypothetical protein
MHINRFASTFAITVSAAALLATGCAPATIEAPVATKVVPAAGGMVHLIGYSLNSDGPDLRVILTGAIGDYGPAVTVHPNGTVDPEHTSELRLGLQKGSFRLNIASLDKKIVNATTHWTTTATCSFYLRVTAATPVVAGSGTGEYRGISGSVSMTVTIDEVDVKPCPGGTSRFLSQLIFLVGSGTLSLG